MKVAVIGAGISGLSAAYVLGQGHDVTLYEREGRLGGHSVTETVTTKDGDVAVDMGFIVFNKRNYPNLTAFFDHLGVAVAKSNMSFGVSAQDGKFEYGTENLASLVAQGKNSLSPAFYAMIRDIAALKKRAAPFLDADPGVTLGDVVDKLGKSELFKKYYLLAMGGAIWDTAPSSMLDFPARTFLRFFDNHGLLSISDHPQWYTVKGGSRSYVDLLEKAFANKVQVSTGDGVAGVRRNGDQVEVATESGKTDTYDQVVFACHSDHALKTIDKPSDAEAKVLGAIRYRDNLAVLHSDPALMPRRRKAWSSWVYLAEQIENGTPRISLSYWMNNLQPLATDTPLIVTINPQREPDPALVHKTHHFEHPLLDKDAIEAQEKLAQVQGTDRLWFCGAWTRHGFHEDGIASALEVAKALGCKEPWA